MVTDCLTDRLGSEPILSIKWSVSIGTMLNFDGDCDGHGEGDGTCKQALKDITLILRSVRTFPFEQILD